MYRTENSLLNALPNQFGYHQLQFINSVLMRFICCRYNFEVKQVQMGTQHNSHIVNQTGETIKIALTDSDNRNTIQVIKDNDVVCIPTCKGRNTLSVITKSGETGWNQKASATYTDDSDRSFIVEKVDGEINIFRSKYGHIREKELRLR